MFKLSLPFPYRVCSFCFGSSPKAPEQTAAPAPAPVPVTTINPVATATDRAKALKNLRYGLASTMKSPVGFTGEDTQLSSVGATGKKTVGE